MVDTMNMKRESEERQGLLERYNFPELIEDYLIELEIRNYSPNTIKTYKSIVKNFYEFLMNEDDLYDDRRVLRSFKRYIQYLKRDKKVTQNYIYLVTVVVKKFFEFSGIDCLEEVKAPKRTKSLPKSLNEEEVKSLINAVEVADDGSVIRRFIKTRDRLILSLLYSSGLRVSELVSLRINDIDPDERTIRIRGKGDKDRIVLFDENTRDLLMDYLKRRIHESEYLFLNRFGDPLTPRYVQNDDKELCTEGRDKEEGHPTHPEALLCNPPPQERCGYKGHTAASGPFKPFNDTDIYQCGYADP